MGKGGLQLTWYSHSEFFDESSKFYSDMNNFLRLLLKVYDRELHQVGFYRGKIPDYHILISEVRENNTKGIEIRIEKLIFDIDHRLGYITMDRLQTLGSKEYDRNRYLFARVYDLINFLNSKGQEPSEITLYIRNEVIDEVHSF